MSWASPAMSTRSASQPSGTAIPRPIWATSSECVSRVRGFSLSRGPDHLGLVGKTAKRRAVQHAGAVAGEVGAVLSTSFRAARRSSAPPPPPAHGRPRRSGPAESSSPRHSLPATFDAHAPRSSVQPARRHPDGRGFLVAPAATAEPPFRLPDYVTDNAGALNDKQLSDVQKAVDQLYSDRHVRLWVVFVDSFAPQGRGLLGPGRQPDQRLQQRRRHPCGGHRKTGRMPSWCHRRRPAAARPRSTTSAATGSNPPCEAATGRVRRSRRPAGSPSAGAALAAAAAAGISWVPAVDHRRDPAAGIGLLMLWSRHRKRKRHEAEVAAAKRVDPTDPAALASVPVDALDDLSRSIVVDVDNAVRTSSNELELAVEEFGPHRPDRSPRPSRPPGTPSSRRSTFASSSMTRCPKPLRNAAIC